MALSVGAGPADGLDEWICPQVTLDSSKVTVELLGIVSGAAMEPNHEQFANYLDKHRGFAAANDQQLIDLLVT